MKGYRIRTGDGSGYYGFEDNYSDAISLLSSCLQHDLKATIEPYEYESQSEKIFRLEKENATLKSERDDYIKIGEDYRKKLLLTETERNTLKKALELMTGEIRSCVLKMSKAGIVRITAWGSDEQCIDYFIQQAQQTHETQEAEK